MFQNHFWSIGFQINSAQEYKELALLALANGDLVTRRGDLQYECWRLNDVELWLQTTAGTETQLNRIIDLSPHFNGSSKTDVVVKERVRRPKGGVLDHAHIATPVENGYSFVFNAPYVGEQLTIPYQATLQVTAFAHQLDVFKDEDTYNIALGSKDGPGWASKSFVACGMFKPDGEKIDPPKSLANFAGVVEKALQLENSYTSKPFQSATVSSYLADFDIVVGPDVYEDPLTEGNVILGTFWMSAKFV